MIERISELPLFGPEEQLRKFICQHEEPNASDGSILVNVGAGEPQSYTQNALTQARIERIDEMLQKQLICTYGDGSADDAYFYWDWAPTGEGDNKWQFQRRNDEAQYTAERTRTNRFSYATFIGSRGTVESTDEMPQDYDAALDDLHARD